jgi:hypothetical protein
MDPAVWTDTEVARLSPIRGSNCAIRSPPFGLIHFAPLMARTTVAARRTQVSWDNGVQWLASGGAGVLRGP